MEDASCDYTMQRNTFSEVKYTPTVHSAPTTIATVIATTGVVSSINSYVTLCNGTLLHPCPATAHYNSLMLQLSMILLFVESNVASIGGSFVVVDDCAH